MNCLLSLFFLSLSCFLSGNQAIIQLASNHWTAIMYPDDGHECLHVFRLSFYLRTSGLVFSEWWQDLTGKLCGWSDICKSSVSIYIYVELHILCYIYQERSAYLYLCLHLCLLGIIVLFLSPFKEAQLLSFGSYAMCVSISALLFSHCDSKFFYQIWGCLWNEDHTGVQIQRYRCDPHSAAY